VYLDGLQAHLGDKQQERDEEICELLEDKNTNLVVISISDPFTIKELAISLTQDLLVRRKRRFTVKPYILVVFDEAQEFISSKEGGLDGKCSAHVETLLRQGRKYGLGVCIATQRIAYLARLSGLPQCPILRWQLGWPVHRMMQLPIELPSMKDSGLR
jgi:DNA helicase HerA-like ATPase